MEQELQFAIVAGADEGVIKFIIISNILGNGEDQHHINLNFLEEMEDEEVRNQFRFERNDIYLLVQVLEIPNEIITPKRNVVPGLIGLCILLRRLAYPNRLKDLRHIFGLSPQTLSDVIKYMSNFILEHWGHLLESLNDLNWLDQNRMRMYAEAIQNAGGMVQNCWGFIDGTTKAICRPTIQQEEYYSGHKRYHCLKYQSVLCPDGIIANLQGAFQGRRHDAAIFRESGLYQQLEQVAVFPNNVKFTLYGDNAYAIQELLLCPFPGNNINLPEHQRNFNASMKVLRTSVEWGFQKILANFAFVDFKKNQKLLLQDLQEIFKVSVILCNLHTSLYGSQTSQYFNVVPPTIQEYLGI